MNTITQPISIGGRQTVLPDEVVFLSADINYTLLYLSNGKKLLVATTLKILEDRFASNQLFFRTHKSFLVNLNKIKSYKSKENDGGLYMMNDYKITISRRKKFEFERRISNINQPFN
jgi:DNA-binding LytR/AlgR family response regulator